VNAVRTELSYISASEAELNELLEGRLAGIAAPWHEGSASFRRSTGSIGVLLEERPNKTVRPYAVVAGEGDQRRFFSRYATLRADLSPISAWCHVLTPETFDGLSSPKREAQLNSFAGAWTGLIIAEALMLAERSVGKLRIAACLSTQTFAVARTKALWDRVSLEECLGRHATAVRLVSGTNERRIELEEELSPIWSALLAASNVGKSSDPQGYLLVEALRVLDRSRSYGKLDEATALYEVFNNLPEARFLRELDQLPPEARVQVFDGLLSAYGSAETGDKARRSSLLFLAGYVATIAAGGLASLTLTTQLPRSMPQVTAWAYVLGGVGERALWTSSFEGLGRLVARELERPLHLDEPPLCDFALDEAMVLVDQQLSDPLVRLKIKQLRVVTVSLLPGVNVAVPLKDVASANERRPTQPVQKRVSSEADLIGVLVDTLWPRIEAMILERERQPPDQASRSQGRRRKGGMERLPLGYARD
jgi:hypothetical protein